MLSVSIKEYDGRLRKYYHITELGAKRLDDFKDEWKEIVTIYRFVAKGDDGND